MGRRSPPCPSVCPQLKFTPNDYIPLDILSWAKLIKLRSIDFLLFCDRNRHVLKVVHTLQLEFGFNVLNLTPSFTFYGLSHLELE